MKYFYLLFLGLVLGSGGGVWAQSFRFTPPENFIQDSLSTSENCSWTNKNAGSVIQIVVSENTSYNSFISSFQDSVLTTQRLIIKEKKDIQVSDQSKQLHPATLFICSFMAVSDDDSKNIEFTRAVCFTGNETMILMAVATIPAMAESVLLSPILNSFENELVLLK